LAGDNATAVPGTIALPDAKTPDSPLRSRVSETATPNWPQIWDLCVRPGSGALRSRVLDAAEACQVGKGGCPGCRTASRWDRRWSDSLVGWHKLPW